jgi:hypothetical protein
MPFAHNVDLVGYDDLDGHSGFKLAMQEVDGRFYLYVAPLWEPGLNIVDVTDPANPRYVRFVDGPPGTWTLQVQAAEGKLVMNMEPIPKGWGTPSETFEEGISIWDASDPELPKLLGKWSPGATGTHRNYYDGGQYVHVATTLPGFNGHLYGAVDITDPANPHLAGRWWFPGQATGEGEEPAPNVAAAMSSGRPAAGMHTSSISLHGGPYVENNRAYCPWMRAGFVTLDVSSPADPQLVSVLPVYPPLGSSIAVHTALPLPDRQLVVINSEALNERCQEPVNFAGIVDMSNERDPVLISLFPVPTPPPGYPAPSFCRKGGRFGPHNQHQPQHQACLQPVGDYIHLTYFNAGLQVFDISDPYAPRIAGYYIPDDPKTRRGPLPTDLVTQSEDVLVDRRGYAYMTDKNAGVTILRFRPDR